ncbi:type II secretion system F family protein [Tolumonas lignilytica]|jgi:Type II secretory pathway, component PulF|uniref:type II secretion system F family protein n=1 Tax=Tolumonas lignilytica TaxID=1283284 RepID=UPI0004675BE8|nr:type II secretion system F family protein [Tolumonas lignilytica]
MAVAQQRTAAATANKPKPKVTHVFHWKGVNRRGQKVSGEMKGETLSQVKADLIRQGIVIQKLRKQNESLLAKYTQSIKPMDIAVLTRQITTMLTAGVPLVQTLQLLAGSHEKKPMREMLASICAEIEAGIPPSKALRQYPRYFDDLYCDLVASGEQSGALDAVFNRIATYKEKAEALKSKIKKALFYPATVIIVALVVTAILLLYVVPEFDKIFKSFGAELPAFTRMVINLSHIVQTYWYFVFGGLIVLIFVYVRAYRRMESVRDGTDKFILKLPIVGMILQKAALARYARTLSTTFAAGLPLIDGLIAASGASGNAVYRKAVLSVRNEVMAGMQMHVAMRTTEVFPEMVIQMIMIGEESGSLDDMLAKVAGIYEQQVDDAVDALSSLIEPLIMVVLGILVGGLVIAMYLPIFKLGSVIH